jgi:GT2 family glycosyltransferase
LIPTRDKPDLLASCIQSLRGKTVYSNIELIIIDNDSVLPETKVLLETLKTQGAIVLDYKGAFNYSAICNFATEYATGEYLCFLNNDTEVISPEWLASMVDHAVQPDTGLVGSVLLYPDGSIQHIGIALGYNFVAGHPSRGEAAHKNIPDGCYQVSAVTFAAAVISKHKFNLIGRLDESLPSGFNDVDISIRARASGLKNIVCVHSTLTHHESQTRLKARSIKGVIRAIRDSLAFLKKHPDYLSDGYFS